MPTRNRKTIHPLIAIAVLLFGSMMLAVGILQRQEGVESSNWPVVPAEVTATSIQHESVTSTGLAVARDLYYGCITYRYEHAGTIHEHTGFAVGGSLSFDTEQEAAAHIAGYPVGRRIEVHVNPALPYVAVVTIGVPTSAGNLLWGGGFIMLLGIIMLVESIRAGSKANATV